MVLLCAMHCKLNLFTVYTILVGTAGKKLNTGKQREHWTTRVFKQDCLFKYA